MKYLFISLIFVFVLALTVAAIYYAGLFDYFYTPEDKYNKQYSQLTGQSKTLFEEINKKITEAKPEDFDKEDDNQKELTELKKLAGEKKVQLKKLIDDCDKEKKEFATDKDKITDEVIFNIKKNVSDLDNSLQDLEKRFSKLKKAKK